MAVWGNHSPAMVPDITFATVEGKAAPSLVDDEWVKNDFMPTVAKRAPPSLRPRRELRRFRRQCRHRPHHDWFCGSEGRWVTMGVPSDGSYGVPEGMVFGSPAS